MDPIVSLRGVGKRYVKYEDVPMLLSRAFRFSASHKRTHIWALRGIDLDVARGETVGVIGRNGSGKSTMFRVLAGVTSPTEGVARVDGRVAPLISVGVGFHPELTGRENVYVNGTILGLTQKEVDTRMGWIVEFAEIGDFLDTPVKFYSSGMFVRLGFSVAVAADPEILLVDEVLAVGDVPFQMRCFERMEEIRRGGATVLVVSHNMNAIRQLCSRTLLLEKGLPRFLGDTDEAISLYHETMDEYDGDADPEAAKGEALTFSLKDAEGKPTAHIRSGDEVTITVEARFTEPADHPAVVMLIKARGMIVYGETMQDALPDRVEPGQVVRCDIRLRASLPSGTYTVQANVRSGFESNAPVARSRPLSFFVSGRKSVVGTADLGAAFEARVVDGSRVR